MSQLGGGKAPGGFDDQFQNMAASRPAQNMSGFTSAQYVGQTLQNA